MKYSHSFLVALSSLLLLWHSSANVIPNSNYDLSSNSFLETRDDQQSWVPKGAPPSRAGETIFDWIDRVIDQDNGNPKFKRDMSTEFNSGNPNIIYERTPAAVSIELDRDVERPSGTETWKFKHVMVDSHCDNGTKTGALIGPIVNQNGQRIETGTLSAITNMVYQTARQYTNVQARFNALSKLVIQNIEDILNYSPLCDNVLGVSAPAKPDDEVLHDELRKLLQAPENGNLAKYYLMVMGTSFAGGAVVATVKAGMDQAVTNVTSDQNWQTQVILGVAYGMTIFVAAEMSAFGPNLAAGPAVLAIAIAAWFKTMGSKVKDLIKKAGPAVLAWLRSEGLVTGVDPGNTVTAQYQQCVDQEPLEMGAQTWGNLPREVAEQAMAAAEVYLEESESAPLLQGQTCHHP